MSKRIWIDKVWGKEEIVVNINQYCLKFLHLNRGYQCSLHYHKIKDETFYISKGTVLMEYSYPNDPVIKEKLMGVGDDIRIHPMMRHRFTGLEDSIIIEISTQHFDGDSYREPGQESKYVGWRLCYMDCPVSKEPHEISNSPSEVKKDEKAAGQADVKGTKTGVRQCEMVGKRRNTDGRVKPEQPVARPG